MSTYKRRHNFWNRSNNETCAQWARRDRRMQGLKQTLVHKGRMQLWIWTTLPTPWTFPEPDGHHRLRNPHRRPIPQSTPNRTNNGNWVTLPVTASWRTLWRRANRGDVFVVGSDVIQEALRVLQPHHIAILWLRSSASTACTKQAMEHADRFVDVWMPCESNLWLSERSVVPDGHCFRTTPLLPAATAALKKQTITVGPWSGPTEEDTARILTLLRCDKELQQNKWFANWCFASRTFALCDRDAPPITVVHGDKALDQPPAALFEALAVGSIVLYNGPKLGAPWCDANVVLYWSSKESLVHAARHVTKALLCEKQCETILRTLWYNMKVCTRVDAFHAVDDAVRELPVFAPPCGASFKCEACRRMAEATLHVSSSVRPIVSP